jgi:hypothetical protein
MGVKLNDSETKQGLKWIGENKVEKELTQIH